MAAPARAQSAADIGPPGTVVATIGATDAAAGRFHRQGNVTVDGAREHVSTVFWRVSHAVAPRIAIDARTSWARISVADGGSPSGGREEHAGHKGLTLGITIQLGDPSRGPTTAVRLGAGYPGGYDPGYTNSLGDGSPVLETALLIGKTHQRWAWSTTAGYRRRGTSFVNPAGIGRPTPTYEPVDVPAERYASVELTRAVGRLSLGIVYEGVDAAGGLDIGRIGWRPDRWPALDQDTHLVGARIGMPLPSRYRAELFAGKTLRGRNAPAYRVIRIAISTRFDTRTRQRKTP